MDEPTKRLLASATRFADIREFDQIDSTNRALMDLAGQGAPEGVVLVADYQSAGRGRLGRRWDAPPGGCLLMSVLLRPEATMRRPDRWWLVGAAVALAAAEACRCRGEGPVPEIKWPNDLLLGGRKLAGILAEAGPAGAARGAFVVGIGINVSWAPPGAACLGPGVGRGHLLRDLLQSLEGWCEHWGDVAGAYRRACATPGHQVRVDALDGTTVGRAEAVEADGRLRVVAGDAVFRFSAADVVHVRPTKVTDP